MNEAYVTGQRELYEFLQQFPVKVERNLMRGALRQGMNQVKPVAQQMARKASGEYARGLKVGTRARRGTVTARLRSTGPHKHLGPWIEFGTRAHNIVAKVGGWLSFLGRFVKKVSHPGARPFPHMRPALDGQSQAALIAAAEYLKEKIATKHGIDTSHVMIEGDEP